MSVEFSWLSYHGQDLRCQVAEIVERDPDRKLISVHDYSKLCSKHRHKSPSFFILSRFIRILQQLGPGFQAEFEDVSFGGKTVPGSLLFGILFQNRIAIGLKKFMSENKLEPGDLVQIVHPVMRREGYEGGVSLLLTDLGSYTEPTVHVWRCHSDLYVDPYPLYSDQNFQHLAFFGYDGTGSMNHAMQNLLKLVKGRGGVTKMDTIAKAKTPNYKNVVFTKYKECLKIDEECPKVQLSLEELDVCSLGKEFIISSPFKADFTESQANELSESIKNNHLEPGDLIALCNCFFCTSSATDPITFLFLQKECFIVLKNQHEKKSKFEFPNYQVPHYDPKSIGLCVEKLNKELDFDIGGFDFLLFKNVTRVQDVLMNFVMELERNGDIVSLKNSFYRKTTKKSKNSIILSYFLKIVLPFQIINRRKTAVLFARELNPDGSFGCFFKIVLFDKFAKKLCMCVSKKQVIKGDVVALINPYVWLNTGHVVSQTIRAREEPFIVELVPNNQNQKIIVCKVTRTDQTRINKSVQILTDTCLRCTETNNSPPYEQSNNINLNPPSPCILCAKTDSNKVVSAHTKNSHSNIKSKELNLNLPSTSSLQNVSSENIPTTVTNKSNCPENNNIDWDISKDGLFFFPFRLDKPDTGEEMDFVSGYCYEQCHQMFVHSVIKKNARNEPLCPNCLLKVKLQFCFQVSGLTRSGRHVSALLVGDDAERILKITCSDFLNNLDQRKIAMTNFKKIIPDSYFTAVKGAQHYKLRLTTVTIWFYN